MYARTDLLSAALRHVRDAQYLAGSSPDQAFHLAGFGPECARKATLPKATYDKAIGHGVGGTSELALGVALSLDARAHRYGLVGWATRYPALAAWTEMARYDKTGDHEEVARLLQEAREVVDRIAFARWADGLVPSEFAWR